MAKKTITLHLAKRSVIDFDGIFTEEAAKKLAAESTYKIDAAQFGDGARLYIFVGDRHEPKWIGDLRGAFSVPTTIRANSVSAALAFRTKQRVFVCTFAHAWTFLDDAKFESNYGLKVAVNALDESRLRGLERANLGDALRGVALSPFQRDLASFGLDDALDLIRRISGRAKTNSTADTMSGSRSWKPSGEFGIEDLPELARESLIYFNSKAYKKTNFRIIDAVMPIDDDDLIAKLDEEVCGSIRNGGDELELSLPVGFDDQAVSYKFYGPRFPGEHPDLTMDLYLKALGDKRCQFDTKLLETHRISATLDNAERTEIKWSLRRALVGSVTYNNERYAISENEWYRVEASFKKSIDRTFKDTIEKWEKKPLPLRKLIDADGNGHFEDEGSYNKRLAKHFDCVLLDTQEVRIPDIERSAFEPCDLLDIANKRFIHVKKSSRRSSILSHFFKQGSNAAQQFKRFEAAWTELDRLVTAAGGATASGELAKARADKSRRWKVIFAIADTPRVATQEFNIPFFSKVSLRDELRTLRAMEYDVGVRFIGLNP